MVSSWERCGEGGRQGVEGGLAAGPTMVRCLGGGGEEDEEEEERRERQTREGEKQAAVSVSGEL